MVILIQLCMTLSAAGFLTSLIVHVCALLSLPQPLGKATWGLHIGIFVVWLPAALVVIPLAGEFKQKDLWKAALRGCPKWMRWMTYAIFIYAAVNFATFMTVAPLGPQPANVPDPPVVFRGFSGHWMAFYSAAFAIMYSAMIVRRRDPALRCPNGHPVSPVAVYCESCGSRIIERAMEPKGVKS